jgi:histidinol phosphatase-like PHP family hydrolase
MRINLLPSEGTVYKANLHCHTKEIDSGDGFTTPLQIKELYKAHGYQIIAFTDNKLSYKDYCFPYAAKIKYSNRDIILLL